MFKVAKNIKDQFSHAYHYLFSYDSEKLAIYSQSNTGILVRLGSALLKRNIILIRFANGHTAIGVIIKRVSRHRFVLADYDHKVYRIVNVNDIFRVDLC
ncbi:hypothetical protein [Lactobacillus psittaci]|uniref:hypothetical protein n=1 Tax=Lactobacillus psittaci TaxID=116089 RepID=UPI00040F06C9|nr:hypothetical protein [Lactobacillus psittaci]